MERIDGANTAAEKPAPAGGGTPGFFKNENAASSTEGTLVTADWLNSVQEEIVSVVQAAGLTLDKNDVTQLLSAVQILASAGGAAAALFHVQDEKTTGTPGGDFTAGAWRTRDLNKVLVDQLPGATLVANQLLLPAGTFEVAGSAPANRVGAHRVRLFGATDGQLLLGLGANSDISDDTQERALIYGRFTLSVAQAVELQHYGATTDAGDGMGIVVNHGGDPTYSDLRIWKMAV